MKLKSLLWICLLSLPICLPAQTSVSVAPDAPSKEDVRKLFDLMASRDQIRQMMEQLFAQMRTLNREQLKQRHPELTEADLARWDRQSEDLIKNFPLDDMLNDMIPVYQRHFTKSELEGLTTFYSSPTGQKFLHEMPAVTAESMRAIYPRIQAQIDRALNRADEKGDSPKK